MYLKLEVSASVDVLFDSCVIDRLAELGINPVTSLHNSEFRVRFTPDLRAEYKEKLSSSASNAAKQIVRCILDNDTEIGFFGFSEEGSADAGPFSGFDSGLWSSDEQVACLERIPLSDRPHRLIPKNRTDSHLVALASNALVITNDLTGAHWKMSPKGSGRIILWRNLACALGRTNQLLTALRLLIQDAG